MTFFDFNSAAEQSSYDLIPKGTVVRVRMTIKPGGYDDPSQGWTGGYATRSMTTGSVYLNCEFVVLDGPFARRKMWSLIGLYSAKGAEWTNMGRTFIKAILNSARGINPNDSSPAAQNARRISGFADLEGIEFVGKVDWDKDQNGQDKCVIKSAVTPEHKDYAAHMNGAPAGAASAPASSGGANAYAQATGRAPVPGRPSWAQ
ncbi:hypothetical protein EBU60_06550 [bacterium]|jgi:hypothetical protein|nr:hypothetical protein [bacterium]NCV14852.1 hypothetical protein [Betaproteobacteria bacterium]NDG83153.1 hypothetical protein [Betaproteobacteria bacterium]